MQEITSERGRAMMSYLPRYYETSRVMRSLLQVGGSELDALHQALDEILAQTFVSTATWGLDRWEQELGLPVMPEQPVQERREKIMSRLRGVGTATLAIIKSVAEAYDKGAVDVIEDHGAYTVVVRFVDTRGVPPNLSDLQAAVRAVLPAHLDVVYQFRYLLWSELDRKQLTWADLDAMGLTWAELEVMT